MQHFISDLDKTLIFSKYPNEKCVETYNNRNITFMTHKGYKLLQEVFEKMNFIPCTMRNITQVNRIFFIKEYNPEYMICTNGAQIYINGELDDDWTKEVRKLVTKEEILHLKETVDFLGLDLIENRNVEDFYLALKFKDTELNHEIELLRKIIPNEYNIQQDGIKIFLLHKNINKANAIKYLNEKYNITNIHVSGDSNADEEMTKLDFVTSYIPKHATFKNDNAFQSKTSGILATEEILTQLLKNI